MPPIFTCLVVNKISILERTRRGRVSLVYVYQRDICDYTLRAALTDLIHDRLVRPRLAPSPEPLTKTGRPPWTGNNTLCSLSQWANSLYVLDADKDHPEVRRLIQRRLQLRPCLSGHTLQDIYIYSFDSDSWSKQITTSAPGKSDLESHTWCP